MRLLVKLGLLYHHRSLRCLLPLSGCTTSPLKARGWTGLPCAGVYWHQHSYRWALGRNSAIALSVLYTVLTGIRCADASLRLWAFIGILLV